MKLAAIFAVGWAVAIAAWFTAWAVGHTVVACRQHRQARRVVKGAEEYLASLPTFTTDPATWPQPRRCAGDTDATREALRRWKEQA